MKIFEQNGKINFVDENNVFVGFNYIQDCCETFGYCILPALIGDNVELYHYNEVKPIDYVLEKLRFDTTFYRTFDSKISEGDIAVFKLRHENTDHYLYIYNYHNGYYAHGFEFCNGEIVIFEGIL